MVRNPDGNDCMLHLAPYLKLEVSRKELQVDEIDEINLRSNSCTE